jgi:5-methylcytosine-specific restriction enzyme A
VPRKWGPCAEPRCPVLCATTYCSAHGRLPYANSDRRTRLPRNWATLRKRVLKRDGYSCYICGDFANEVDHIRAGDDNDPENLAAICHPCHMSKSGHEGGIAQGRYRQ